MTATVPKILLSNGIPAGAPLYAPATVGRLPWKDDSRAGFGVLEVGGSGERLVNGHALEPDACIDVI